MAGKRILDVYTMNFQIAAPDTPALPYQFLATYLVDEHIAFDAGCLGVLSLEDQRRVKHVFLSHSHLDHVATLGLYLDNVYRPDSQCPTIYALQETWDALGRCVFNDVVWPDLVRLSREESPFVRFQAIRPNEAVEISGIRVTPLELEHVVPTCGFLVENDVAAIALVSDTGPTEKVWQKLNEVKRLDALFLEASFPDRMQWLADKTRHLTPRTFAEQRAKLRREVTTYAVHIKPAFYDDVTKSILELGWAEPAQADRTYVIK